MNNDHEREPAALDVAGQPPFSAMQALVSLLNQGQFSAGEMAATEMTKSFPLHGFGWKLLGVMLKLQHKHGPALLAMHRSAELLPDDEEAQSNFGMALAEANELPAAESFLRRALALNPRSAQANSNLGNLLCRQGRLREAEACQRLALEIQPENIAALCNLGSTLHDLGRDEEAQASYRRALAIKPDFAQAQWHSGMAKLLAGDLVEGWKLYEWRWKTDDFLATKPRFWQVPWQGHQSLQGKTLLLHAEQGLGDTIQFCRYAKLAAARGARVILQVPPALIPLLTGLAGMAKLIGTYDVLPPFDFHCPLLSLPHAFGTDLSSIPAEIPYLFALPSAVAAWRKRMPPASGMRIGIAWSGNPLHRHDYKRSIALTDFARIFEEQAQFFCLQKEVRASDQPALRAHADRILFCGELQDFAQTAGLIDAMDLVIAVDTAVAHLAAAMGKPVWILLPFRPDWRWLTQRADSPWYPNARLFRQPASGDWDSVLGSVRQALRHWGN